MDEMADSEVLKRCLNPVILNLREMELELKCPTCLTLLDMPMMLPCTHIFCSHCIAVLPKNESECPSCKLSFLQQDLRPAGYIKSLLNIYKEMNSALVANFPDKKSNEEISDKKMPTRESPLSDNNHVREMPQRETIDSMVRSKNLALKLRTSNAVTTKEGASDEFETQRSKIHMQTLGDDDQGERYSRPSSGRNKDLDCDNSDTGNTFIVRGRGIHSHRCQSTGCRHNSQEADDPVHEIEAQGELARELFPSKDDSPVPASDQPSLLTPTNRGFTGVDNYSRKITTGILKWVNGPYTTWREFPEEIKRHIYEKFRNNFSFPGDVPEKKIWDSFNTKASSLYRNKLYGHRKARLGPNDMYNWDKLGREENRPSWVTADDWMSMIEKWSGKNWQKKSAAARECRMSQPERNIYTGGCQPMDVHERRMAPKLGRKPTHVEVFRRTKMRDRGDKLRSFAREHDKKISEDYEAEMRKRYGEDQMQWPYVDPEIWMMVAHTPSQQHPKPRIYGFGETRDISAFFPNDTPRGRQSNMSSRSYGPSQLVEDERFRLRVRKLVMEYMAEMQRTGSYNIPSFIASSSRPRPPEDEGGKDDE